MLSIFNSQTFQPTAHEDWNEEIDSILEKNFRIAAILTVCLNTFFGIVNFYLDTFGGVFDFGLRLMSSAAIGALFLYRDKIPFNIRVKIAIPLSVLILQDAFIMSRLPEEEYINYAVAHSANFVGAALFIIWPPRFSVIFWAFIAAMHIGFFAMFSDASPAVILSNGGWLLIGVLVLTVAFIHIRYSGLRNMINVRRELERNNEWMQVQHGIIESKSAELQRSNQRLKEFAYIVSHDLKAPLRGINNIVGWLEEDCGKQLDSTGKSHLELLKKQVVKMEHLIASVLEYSKAENKRKGSEWIDLDELVNDLVETVGTDGRTVFCLKIGVARMQGTRIVVSQVLQNLVTNSIKHNNKDTGKVEVEIRDLGEMLCFSVTDNGPGIAPGMSEKIFDLYTTCGSADGYTNTGIGLSVARKLVEESGGKLWLDPGMKEGTRFCFTLPHAS